MVCALRVRHLRCKSAGCHAERVVGHAMGGRSNCPDHTPSVINATACTEPGHEHLYML